MPFTPQEVLTRIKTHVQRHVKFSTTFKCHLRSQSSEPSAQVLRGNLVLQRLISLLDSILLQRRKLFFFAFHCLLPRNSVQQQLLHTISGSVGYLIDVYLISLLVSLVFNFAFIGIWKKLQNNPRKKFLAEFSAPFFIFSSLNRESKIPRNTSCLAKTRN